LGKKPSLLHPASRSEQRKGIGGVGGANPGGQGLGWLRGEGEGREGPARSIPGRSSGGGGPGRPGRDGVRQRAAAALGRRLRVTAVGKGRGKRKREPRGYRCPPWLGLWRCGEGSSAVAGARGGGDGEWWCWEFGMAVVERTDGAGGLL